MPAKGAQAGLKLWLWVFAAVVCCAFAGKRPPAELPRFLALADVVASPRRKGVNTPFKVYTYLASGRPALVQDTGWTAHLPHGEGLLAFSTPEEALAGIDSINSAYEAHARRAREVARDHFDAARILPLLLDVCSR